MSRFKFLYAILRDNFGSTGNLVKSASLEEAEEIFENRNNAVKKSGIAEVIKVAAIFANHLRSVLNAMTGTTSNAIAERLNGKIRLLKAVGRGSRKFENFRSAILFFYGKLSLFPLNYPIEPFKF